jgi:hypothetical protein
MAERRPNSVLFSLKELRRIEDDRVKTEDDQEKQRREDEVRAREDAERRARDEVERKRLEEEDRIRREQEERERQSREEQLRLQEAERRARVEAEMKLEQSRIAMEIEAKARAKKLPWPLIGTIIGVLVVGSGGLGYFLWQKSKEADAKAKEIELAKQEKERLRKETEEKDRIYQQQQEDAARKLANLGDALKSAKSDAQRKALREAIASENRAKADRAAARERQRKDEIRRAKKIRTGKCPPNDPLCGIE